MQCLPLVAATLLLAACQSPKTQIAALDRPAGGTRIVLMPLDVELFEVAAFGGTEPRQEWTENAKTYLLAALREEEAARGLVIAEYDVGRAPTALQEQLDQIERVHALVGRSILDHHYILGHDLPTKERNFDWSLGPSVRALKKATDARYALFIMIRDSYSGIGHVAVQAAMALLFLTPVPGGLQTGFASLVDLETGNIVWYNRVLREFGDLRSEEAARKTAKAILEGLPK